MHQAAVAHPPSTDGTEAPGPHPLLHWLGARLAALRPGWACTLHIGCDGDSLLLVENTPAGGSWVLSALADGRLSVEALVDDAWLAIEGIMTPDQAVRRFARLPVDATGG